jgi:ribosomal protein S1
MNGEAVEWCVNCGAIDTSGHPTCDWDAVCPSCGNLTWIARGQVVTVRVSRLTDFGVFVDVGGGTRGLIHITEIPDATIHHPSEIIDEGDVVTAKVLRVDLDERKIGLSLKRVPESQ